MGTLLVTKYCSFPENILYWIVPKVFPDLFRWTVHSFITRPAQLSSQCITPSLRSDFGLLSHESHFCLLQEFLCRKIEIFVLRLLCEMLLTFFNRLGIYYIIQYLVLALHNIEPILPFKYSLERVIDPVGDFCQQRFQIFIHVGDSLVSTRRCYLTCVDECPLVQSYSRSYPLDG